MQRILTVVSFALLLVVVIAWNGAPERTVLASSGNVRDLTTLADIGPFSEGLAVFCWVDDPYGQGDGPKLRFGYMKPNGMVAIWKNWDAAYPFSNGVAWVRQDPIGWCIVTKAGKISPVGKGVCPYASAFLDNGVPRFEGGVSAVVEYDPPNDEGADLPPAFWGYMKRDGKWVLRLPYPTETVPLLRQH